MAIDEHQQRTDGRMQRSQRTRKKIRDAFLEIVREGDIQARAPQIAERAGVSLRTLWATFGDMENLRATAVQYMMESDEALRTDIDPHIPRAERIKLFCAERERRLVNIAPAAVSADRYQSHSEALMASRRRYQDELRSDVRRVFGVEIEHSSSPKLLVESIAVNASWDVWHLLTENLGMTIDASRDLMAFSIGELVDGIPAGLNHVPEHNDAANPEARGIVNTSD